MGIRVVGTSNQLLLEVLKLKKNLQKNKVGTGKTPFFVRQVHFVLIILFILKLACDMAVLYENDGFFSPFN